jgi:hypothetical protein
MDRSPSGAAVSRDGLHGRPKRGEAPLLGESVLVIDERCHRRTKPIAAAQALRSIREAM